MTHLQKIISEIQADNELLAAVGTAAENLRGQGFSYSDTAAALGMAEKVGRFYRAFYEYEALMQEVENQLDSLAFADHKKFSGDLNATMRPLVRRIKAAVERDTAEGNAPKLQES